MYGPRSAVLIFGLAAMQTMASAESLLVNASANSGTGLGPSGASSSTPFSSDFKQPVPPSVNAAFRASWNQHKWDINVSNIASGFVYHSPANQAVRADAAYDNVLESSLFDYTNITADGLVSNRVYMLSPSVAAPPRCQSYSVLPAFPLLPADVLVSNDAVYAGIEVDPMNGMVTKWELFFQGSIPVTVYLNSANTIVGYDFFTKNLRTKTITRFFNVIVGEMDKSTFEFPGC